ncbi:MAG: CE1759 family FMN reductase [Propionibacteriaceae bacterium]
MNTETRTIAVVSAGLGQPSSTRLLADRLAEATVAALADRGVTAEVQLVELRDLAADIANAMVTGFGSGALAEAKRTVAEADGLIAVTPIFSASYSGLFKSFFDVLDADSLDGLPMIIGATGGSARHNLALEHAMRPLFSYLHAEPVPTAVYAASVDWAGDGAERTSLPQRVQQAATQLAQAVAGREPRQATDEMELDADFESMLLGG